MNTYMKRKAAMKNRRTLKLSLLSDVKIRLVKQAITKSSSGKPSATGLTGSLAPAAAIRK